MPSASQVTARRDKGAGIETAGEQFEAILSLTSAIQSSSQAKIMYNLDLAGTRQSRIMSYSYESKD